MEDRVGDVLARRASLDSGIASGVVLSILLHAGLTAAAVWAAMHAPAPQTANILSIKFAPMKAGGEQRAASRPAPQPKPPVAQPKPKEEPVEVPVTATTPPAKVQPKTVPLNAFGKSTKKGSEHAPAPPAPAPVVPAAKPGIAAPGDIAAGSAGVTGLEGGDFPYTIYLQRMWKLIGDHWSRPQVSPGTAATVYFAVDRDGAIRDVRLETASSNATFDRNAQRAILEASPLPPLPYGYAGTYLGVHLTFK